MQSYLQAFISLLAIFNPVVAISVYMSYTDGLTKQEKTFILYLCGITATGILVFFFYFGSMLLALLSIHIYALQFGGGIIILLAAINLILKNNTSDINKLTSKLDLKTTKTKLINIAIAPLTLPIIVGPGAIVMVMLLNHASDTITHRLIMTGIILATILTTIIILSLADLISKVLGEIGILVLGKIFGLILTAVACEMLITAINSVVMQIYSNLH
jgi:multiple antibiotic resistance protein